MWNAPPMGTGTILFRYYVDSIITALQYVYVHRYAFVDTQNVYWANQTTGTVDEGK